MNSKIIFFDVFNLEQSHTYALARTHPRIVSQKIASGIEEKEQFRMLAILI